MATRYPLDFSNATPPQNAQLDSSILVIEVTLPAKDPVLAPGIFGEGSDGPRHFDFSDAPDVPGFDMNACQDEYNIGGNVAYRAYLRAGMTG